MSSWLASAWLSSPWTGSPWLGSCWGWRVSADALVFEALTFDPVTYEMLGVKTGTGVLSNGRASERYALNDEDLYYSVAAYEAAWNGGRNVQNLLSYSEDFSNASWLAAAGTVKEGVVEGIGPNGEDAMEVSFTGSNSRLEQTPIVGFLTRHYTNRVLVAAVSGTAKIRIRNGWGTISSDITLTETFQWISYPSDNTITSIGGAFRVQGGLASQDNFYIIKAHLEDATGRADTTTPSEYCPTDTVGAGDPSGYKIFANENGNTVASNVVTEAAGIPLASVPFLSQAPAATNVWEESRGDWTDIGSPNKTQDQVGIDGLPNKAWRATDNDGAGVENIQQVQNPVTTVSGCCLIVHIAYEDDETSFPAIGSSPDTTRLRKLVNRKTGALIDYLSAGIGTTAEWDAYEVVRIGDFWKYIFHLNSALAAATFAVNIYPALQSSWVEQNFDVAATGSVTVDQVELHIDKTIAQVRGLPPIFTEGAAVSVTADEYTFDASNWSNPQGLIYCEVEYPVSTAEHTAIGDAFNIINNGTGSILRHNASNQIQTLDGTESTRTLESWAAGDLIKIAVAYSALEAQKIIYTKVGAAAVKTQEESYDGAYGTALMTLFGSIPYSSEMRNLRRYDLAYDAAKDKIDELMA